MLPGFLLVVALIAVALAAPVILAIALALVATPTRRALGVTMLQGGAVGAAVGGGLVLVARAFENAAPAVASVLLAAGLGFSVSAIGFPLFEAWDDGRGRK